MQEPFIRWLHLTDLHIGKDDESQRTALNSLLAAINQAAAGKPFDFVFLTGDLAYSGQKAQYEELQRLLIEPLRSNSLFSGAKFIATPGNHDIDCSVGPPPVWLSLGSKRQDTFFHSGEIGRKARDFRSSAFKQYAEFVKESGIESVDPTKEPAYVMIANRGEKQVALISVVTCFFSDSEVSDQQRTPAPCHALRTLLQQYPIDTPAIILGHHPPEWFTPETELHLQSLLIQRSAIYIHGHEHRVKSKCSSRGLIYLGFGAAYQATSESPPKPYYRNSFAICELGESLHVSITSWDSEHGQWRSEQIVPPDFFQPSSVLANGFSLPLPSTPAVDQSRPYSSIATAIRSDFRIESCIWLAEDSQKRWTELLSTIGAIRNVTGTFSLPTQTLPVGHCQIRIRDQAGNNLVHGISAHGDVFNYEQLQTLNTELDRQDYQACIVATLGQLGSDAKTLATQLASKKPIVVLERTDIVRRAVRKLPPAMERALLKADSTVVAGSLVITQTGFALIFQERTSGAWFQVIGEDGRPVPESSPLVNAIRRELPALRKVRYDTTDPNQVELPLNPNDALQFDRRRYLDACRAFFNDVKYAPLAALGFKFRTASLSDIYVEASADVGGTAGATHDLTRAVSELVESFNLSEAQREQLEAQLRSRYGLTRSAEVGAASRLYQRFNNVVVLGDPGSGKTCFVQHEILSYCEPAPEESNWYSVHLPIYVSLAEAARLLDDKTDLLDICTIVSSRRGIELPRKAIEHALSDGRAAFFFDGLDEVGYIERRISLLAEIDKLVKSFGPRGNRFVLTSRPAAVQPVEIPETLTYLHLRGLTEDEIRILAGRVLTVRLGEEQAVSLKGEEIELIDRLIEDTRNSPGIARIARNPLLLTLLVLIYANTGALSARRHVIYTQAIKTLVSVRGRLSREQQISEADLRTRLGALGLNILQRKIAEIPTRSEVVEILKPLIARPLSEDEPRSDAELATSFIQEVAEVTGLLSIHSREESESEDLVTFMHYSFLEYYAAAGLLLQDFKAAIPGLANIPRWRDVITLLFGILSEQSDISELLQTLLADESASEQITKYKLLLALDCASECDVPPEVSQELLAKAIYETISRGAGRHSVSLREEIAGKLEYFLEGAGPRIVAALGRGLREKDPIAAAAFSDLLARFGDSVELSDALVRSFVKCLEHEHPVTRAATLLAIEQRRELRTEETKSIVKKSLKGSLIEKHAALKVIASVPIYQDYANKEVMELLDDSNPLIAALAAQVLLANALKGDTWTATDGLMEKVLLRLGQGSQDTDVILEGITLDTEMVRGLIQSNNPIQCELAIRYTSLIRDNDHFVHQILMQKLRSEEAPRFKAACLDALRMRPSAIQLITIADTDLICAQLRASDRNVRLAAIRLLGEMPDDEQVVSSLQDHLKISAGDAAREEELTESAKALANHVKRNEKLRKGALEAVLEQLPRSPDSGFGDQSKQQHTLGLLLVCELIGGVADNKAAVRLLTIANSYRTPPSIRRQAMRVFGKIAEPTKENAEIFSKLLGRNDSRMNETVYAATASFISQCRKKVEYFRRVQDTLPELSERVRGAWEREVARSRESIDPAGLRDIRNAVLEINNLTLAYSEYSGRTTIT